MGRICLSEFADKINECMPIIMNRILRRNESELLKGKITMPQFLMLSFLDQHGESNMTALARYMGVSTPAVTGIVDRLVRDKYAVRAYEQDDRRIIKIHLTPKGNELVKRIDAQKRQLTIKVFSCLSDTDRHNYLKIITKIKDRLALAN